MTELVQTGVLIAMICVVEWLMRMKVKTVTHPKKTHKDRPDQVVHETDKERKIYGV